MPRLVEELWVSRFASQLMREQPVFGRDFAVEVGALAWQHMSILIPERAVADFLLFIAEEREAGRVASQPVLVELFQRLSRGG